MIVAVGRGEVQRHRTRQVAGQLRTRGRIRRLGPLEIPGIGRIDEGGDAATRVRIAGRLQGDPASWQIDLQLYGQVLALVGLSTLKLR